MPYIIGAVVILIIIISNISIVQQSYAYVIERLGAFHKVWSVGMHIKIPFIVRIAKKVSEQAAREQRKRSSALLNAMPAVS